MAEEERILSISEKDGTDASQSKDTYIPEEPTPDISISLLDIQMPETPDSTKGQASDGDTSRLESPKALKPVLGKVQAKKRLMAFANQFKALPKSQVKPNLSQHSTGSLKTKDKTVQDDINKSKKKTEEKILAIEEIRREESKSKMLLAEAMAAVSMEDENYTGKNISSVLESKKHTKEKSKHEEVNNDRKNRSVDQKYSERPRHRDKINKDSSNQDVKNRSGSIERFTQKSSQNRGKHKKDKKKKNDKDKRNGSKIDTNRDKKEEGKDKKEIGKEKQEETKEKTEVTKNNKENLKERRNDISEMEVEGKDKREKDKDKWKEKILSKSNSWAEVRKSGLTLDDIIHLRRRDNSERSVKIRTAQDYTRCFEQMLMLNNHRLKRQALIAEGLDGPKKYPPESIKLTKRARGLQLLYCENPRISLLLSISQLLQAVSPERRERIRDICEASLPRIDIEDTVQQKRNWYRQINTINYHKDTKWQMTIQFPKSKWDSEDEEISSINVTKEEIEEPINKLYVSENKQERCSTTSNVMEDKIDNNAECIKEDNKFNEEIIENITANEVSISLLHPAGNEKLASEYEQFMKMVCTATDMTEKYSPKKNPVKSTSPHSYHEFNIASNLAEDNTNMEIPLKEKFEKKNKLETLEESIKSTECEESTLSTDCQIQVHENNVQIEHTNENDESQDSSSKSIPSDWENVRIKVERLSDENTESREIKKKKKKKMISSSDSSSSITSSDSEKQKKKRKRKRKVLSNSSSSDSDSTDSSSSSSDSSSSEERRKRKRKKKKIGKKRKKVKRTARIKKKRKRKMSTDSNSSDLDKYTKKKKRCKKKMETKSINNGDIRKIISKSPVIASSETKILQSETSIRKIKEEVAGEDKKKTDQVISIKKTITDMNVHDNECLKQRKERKESNPDESFIEQWEMDSMTKQQYDGETSSQDCTEELEKMDSLEKTKYRRKRKHSRNNIEQEKDKSSKVNEERNHEGKARSDEEIEAKRKKRKDKDIKSSNEFLANWERESERISQRIQNEAKYLKKLEKQKTEIWGETDFDTLNVPSLTQLEKEVYQKQLLADEWEVDSLEAISDLVMSKRKNSQGSLKKTEKEVKYDKTTDTYIAIEKESVREMKKKQERLYAIRIWEEEQEEGEREEMMLLEQKSKTNDWDIEEKSVFHKTTEEMEVCKINDIDAIQKEWAKTDENKDIKEDANKLTMKSDKLKIKKSRWDMGSQSEEKSEAKDIWEEEYVEWSKINKCEQELKKTKKGELCSMDYSENSSKSDLIDFYHRKLQSRESLEISWTSDEMAIKPMQAKKDALIKQLISAKTNEEQFASINEHQTRDQFKEISETDVKFKEKTYTVELYSPSSPALSQKSQDVEVSNESSSCNSLLREKRKKEMLVTADELSIPMSGIPLQLVKCDTKHTSSEKIENILNKIQLEDRDSVHNFDIKTADNLFNDISINKSCSKIHTSGHMDIFAEYGSEKCNKECADNSNVNSTTHTKVNETNEGKNTLKLIPKQLLIRRTNEQVKPKRILETPLQDPAQHAAALLTIQKKLLESHALKNDIKEYPNQEQADHFEQKYGNRDIITSNSRIDNTLLDTTEFSVVSKASVIAIRQSKSPISEKAVSVRSEQSENYDRESKNDDVKRYKANRNLNETNISSSIRSPIREHRKRSPSKKENEKRYSYDKDKKERKSERTSDDIEKLDRRDPRSSKADFADRRKFSPLGRGRRRKSRSPYVSWERQRSGSRSPGHSWSRSRSKSPKRKDDAIINTRDKDKKRERYDDERCKSRMDERKERYTRSPLRFGYNEDNFKKHGIISSKSNRNDWGRRRYDNTDRDHEKDTRLYDPIEILRERTMESEKYKDNRFHIEESIDHTLWQYENSNILRDGNESIDSYTVGQDLPLEYDDRSYYREGSLERDMIQSSPQSLSKYRRRSNVKRERQWEKDIDPSDLDRHLRHRLRNRTLQRSRYSPVRQERFRRKSRSRSWSPLRSRTRSRSRSGSRSRSTSRSRLRMRSQSRSKSRSPFDIRGKSVSMLRLRSPEHSFRMSELRSSRSPSPGRDRLNEIGGERKEDDENKNITCEEKGRRIETIVQSGIMPGTSILDSEMGLNSSMDATVTNFQYSNEIEGGNEYYYTENNLTYPPCIDESSISSPKRLSLDDRLELELGIKKQHNKDSTGVTSEYSNFNPNVIAYPSPPPQQQQIMYRRQPTVVQVGNVLQVVPADFNGVQTVRHEVSATVVTPPVRSGSSQVVRVGNVLQVVPTSLDWSTSSSGGGGQSSTTTDQSSVVLYSSAVPAHSPSASMSVPVPVPVPLPVPPTLPATTNTLAPVATMSPVTPLPLSLPIPVPMPVPIPPATAAAFPRNEVQPQKIIQPVYNYEAILETRRKEQEERKRLRDLRRKEKERRRIERVNRRALRLLEKSNTSRQMSGVLLDQRKSSIVDPSVLKALKEGDEQAESSSVNPIKEEEAAISIKEEDEDAAVDEEEDDEDEVEAEAEDDEEEEEEAEDEDEDYGDDEKSLQGINQRIEVDETTSAIMTKDQAEIDTRKEWPVLPPPPLKGILVVPGFSPNGNLDDLSDADNNIKDNSDKDEEIDKNNEYDKDIGSDAKSGKSNLAKLKKTKRNKKSVQFADGVKPGEGTSPSGGEGDMPSPPPPKGIGFREGLGDLRRDKIYSSRKNRKQEKRTKPPKAKKKVKVRIKLKKPRITPLTAMMMDDSDEMDDRSPPPPPPGSPPPPHLWPSYLSIYNTTVRAVEQPQTTTATLTSVQAAPPPTPLPLLIPPPPLNYTIQPCSKS